MTGLKEEWAKDRAKKTIYFVKRLWERYRDLVLLVLSLYASSPYERDRPFQPSRAEEVTLAVSSALDVLSMPAMSAEPERIFSGGRHTVSLDRGKLSFEMLEKLECRKSWDKKSFPQNIKI
jgi:hypothetical protein